MEQNKEEQKKLLTEIMEADEKDGLYKRQTAVDWLFSQIPFEWSSSLAAFEALQQVKEMEKQQIIDAHNHGFTEGVCFGATTVYKYIKAEQYYNKTFKK
jgi:hypothetical protein